MLRNLLLLTSLFSLGACSLQFDSQYGIRFEPAKIEADASRAQPRLAEEWTSPALAYSAPETAPEAWSAPAEMLAEANYFASESHFAPLPNFKSLDDSIVDEPIFVVESEQTTAAAVT